MKQGLSLIISLLFFINCNNSLKAQMLAPIFGGFAKSFKGSGNVFYRGYTTTNTTPATSATAFDNYFKAAVATSKALGTRSFSGINNANATNTTNILNWNSTANFNTLNGTYTFSDNFLFKAEGIFIPKYTGVYTFTLEGDDAVDLFINSTNVVNHYGEHAINPVGTHTGTIFLTAGQFYTFRIRLQQLSGGTALQLFWRKPNETSGWYQDSEELAAISSINESSKWAASSVFAGDSFNATLPYPSTVNYYHITPWLESPQGWSAGTNNTNQWLKYDNGSTQWIIGIVTQGREGGDQWVTTAKIEYSTDNSIWYTAIENATLNTDDQTTKKIIAFPKPVNARYVRVSPLTWRNHITMRLGIVSTSNQIAPDGLVLHLDAGNSNSYTGTGTTWYDISGNAYNGTLTNGPTYNVSNNGYFSFDGTNDYVNGVAIPSTSGNNSRTVMAWYKSTANQNTIILDKGFTNLDTAEQLFIAHTNGVDASPPTNPGGIYLAFWGNDIYYPIASSTLFDGNWHFVAYTYNNTNSSVQICFDGVFANSIYYWNSAAWTTLNTKPFPLARSLNTTNNPYFIGRNRGALWSIGGNYANASVPVVQIYNRALTEQEILINFNALKSRYGL